MKKALFTGSCVALVTPFTEDGVNWDKLESLIEWHIAQGTDAILTCGQPDDPSDPGFTSQTELYSAGQLRPVRFTPDDVAAATVGTAQVVTGYR